MPTYAAFLGHQPHISIAELAAAVPGFSMKRVLGKKAVIFESPAELTGKWAELLGGTVVLATMIESPNALSLGDIPKVLTNELKSVRSKKVTFGLRPIDLPPAVIHELYRKGKKACKDRDRPCRYIGNARKPAAPVLLRETAIMDGSKGCELVILPLREKDAEEEIPIDEVPLWLGKTFWAQDIDAYTWRDMGKPVRDTTTGLLPPKLAQILLNFGHWIVSQMRGSELSAKFPTYAVFDPFCGTGVIPMECLLRGWEVLASDISLKAVNGCTKNLEWLRKERKILKKDTGSSVWKQDAEKPFDLKEKPDMIVTETTLGPALMRPLPLKEASKLKTESERVQAGFLRNAAATLPGVPIVCTWPVWYHSKGCAVLEKVWDVLGELGYSATLPPGIEPSHEKRVSLFYRRPDQYVGREIVILRPKRS